MSSDAYHISAPSEDGDGPIRVMQHCARRRGRCIPRKCRLHQRPRHLDARRRPDRDDGDQGASSASTRGRSPCRSTKSMMGHLLGAAGRRRERGLHPRDPERHHSADHQPDAPRPRVRPRLRARHGAQGRRWSGRSPTPSASAAPTLPFFFASTTHDRTLMRVWPEPRTGTDHEYRRVREAGPRHRNQDQDRRHRRPDRRGRSQLRGEPLR